VDLCIKEIESIKIILRSLGELSKYIFNYNFIQGHPVYHADTDIINHVKKVVRRMKKIGLSDKKIIEELNGYSIQGPREDDWTEADLFLQWICAAILTFKKRRKKMFDYQGMSEDEKGKLSKEIISTWKGDEDLRREFQNSILDFAFYFFNKEKTVIISGAVSRYGAAGKTGDVKEINAEVAHIRKGDSLEHRERYYGDAAETMEEIKTQWETDKALQDEFGGDFEAFRAYRLNNPRVGD